MAIRRLPTLGAAAAIAALGVGLWVATAHRGTPSPATAPAGAAGQPAAAGAAGQPAAPGAPAQVFPLTSSSPSTVAPPPAVRTLGPPVVVAPISKPGTAPPVAPAAPAGGGQPTTQPLPDPHGPPQGT